jgi:hypothetical protein
MGEEMEGVEYHIEENCIDPLRHRSQEFMKGAVRNLFFDVCQLSSSVFL